MAGWVSVRSLCATLAALACAAAAAPAAWPTFPGLNGQLAYEASLGGGPRPNVFTIQPLAVRPEDHTRLPSSGAIDRDAAWSADGRRIAFMSERDGNPEIYVMDATPGSVPTRLTFDAAVDADPTFSLDGKRLAFTSTRDGNPEIYVMAEDGSGQTRLTFDPAADQQADWSPDGTRIAFESNRDGNMEIYSMNPDGGDVARLTFDPGRDADASWHPDGRSIAFVSSTGATQNIFTLRPGASPNQLTRDIYAQFPAWSPDGEQIAFTASGSTRVRKVDASGTGQVAANGTDAAWGPLPSPPRVPELSETVNLKPTGTVFVHVNGAAAAAPLEDPLEIPVGSVIDTTRGEVQVKAATLNEQSTSSVDVSEGRATLSQTDDGVTVLRLPRHPCCGDRRTRLRTQTRARTTAPTAARRRGCRRGGTISPKHARTWGCLTDWTTIRAGRKTTVRVRRGVVEVRDFVRDKTVRVGDCQRRNRDCWHRDWYVIRARR
jgi:WD40 repeat protein